MLFLGITESNGFDICTNTLLIPVHAFLLCVVSTTSIVTVYSGSTADPGKCAVDVGAVIGGSVAVILILAVVIIVSAITAMVRKQTHMK